MSDEEESVTEAKSSTLKRKTVLDAMAKYNLKKQQEKLDQEQNAAKSVVKVEKNDGDGSVGKCPQLKRKLEQEAVSRYSETSIGIIEYISKSVGFSGILKQRYSDFQVNEIDLEGNVVQLSSLLVPKIEVSAEMEDTSVLTDQEWEEVESVVKGDKESYSIDVTDRSKEDRNAIHKALRQKHDTKLVSNTDEADGRKMMVIKKPVGRQGGVEKQRLARSLRPAPYTRFVLYKENKTTVEAIGRIAHLLRMKPAGFQYAGTKDRRAKTSQLVTVLNLDPDRLAKSVKNNQQFAVGNFAYVDKPLKLGDLKGNRFHIVLRNVIGEQNMIEENLNLLKDRGFINYYGSQRFGTRHVPTHHVGKELILGRWQKAIDLILKPAADVRNHERDLSYALNEYAATRDAAKAYRKIGRNAFSNEGQLILSLMKTRGDLVGALDALPRNLRLTYIHAYQSYIWNNMVSKRLSVFGFQPIIGDLVYSEPCQDDVNEEEPENAQKPDTGPVNNYGEELKRTKPSPILVDESNISNYTIYDVILPMPGYESILPANQMADFYNEFLRAEGIDMNTFKQRVKAYSLAGAYRRVLTKPIDLEWKFIRYNDATESLLASDWDRLQNADPYAGIEDGVYLGLILEFNLTASSYATMAIREITKMDMSSHFQTTLNDAGVGKHEAKKLKEESAGPV